VTVYLRNTYKKNGPSAPTWSNQPNPPWLRACCS